MPPSTFSSPRAPGTSTSPSTTLGPSRTLGHRARGEPIDVEAEHAGRRGRRLGRGPLRARHGHDRGRCCALGLAASPAGCLPLGPAVDRPGARRAAASRPALRQQFDRCCGPAACGPTRLAGPDRPERVAGRWAHDLGRGVAGRVPAAADRIRASGVFQRGTSCALVGRCRRPDHVAVLRRDRRDPARRPTCPAAGTGDRGARPHRRDRGDRSDRKRNGNSPTHGRHIYPVRRARAVRRGGAGRGPARSAPLPR